MASTRTEDTGGLSRSAEIPAVAAGDTSTVIVANIPYDGRVIAVKLVPRAAITANATNYGTLSIQNRGGTGAGNTVVATRSWAAGNSVQGTKEWATLSGTPANLEVKEGDQIVVVHTTAGTGLAMPAFGVVVTYLAR